MHAKHSRTAYSLWIGPLVVIITFTCLLFTLKGAGFADTTYRPQLVRNDVVAINIQASQQTYRARDTIQLRVGLKNLTSSTYAFYNGAPWRLANLVLSDEQGHVIPHADGDSEVHGIITILVVNPGQTQWLEKSGTDWTSLRSWGYGDIAPGTYTVSAIPVVRGWLYNPAAHTATSAQGEFITDAKTMNSNRVTIQIVP
jgi:hypothetical protein